ncbi:hypothetical protein CYLTODRAFT_416229 [Cylindrobasidium torrendii FP15055 ss-10]|uniref:Uncharacterized protein n=1 Tax=Cylindrobasidium torrendii FP15055 ss-10 TaxID=1314674 RepID=A0A0D7BVW8_9AGAR|nr:hypothetical protein CYLTODRAFT_416229 [Cylindrobasidium torrendii FP15055 ss-10]
MASEEQLNFNEAHPPQENSITAFGNCLKQIKFEIVKSRNHWDKHEPKMWRRAQGVSDEELVNFTLEDDLVLVRSAATSYGTIILGKIRLPAIQDGYVHIRIHDVPGEGTDNVRYHSLWTDEGTPNEDGQPTTWNAIQTQDTPLEFFNE